MCVPQHLYVDVCFLVSDCVRMETKRLIFPVGKHQSSPSPSQAKWGGVYKSTVPRLSEWRRRPHSPSDPAPQQLRVLLHSPVSKLQAAPLSLHPTDTTRHVNHPAPTLLGGDTVTMHAETEISYGLEVDRFWLFIFCSTPVPIIGGPKKADTD